MHFAPKVQHKPCSILYLEMVIDLIRKFELEDLLGIDRPRFGVVEAGY
jgi:hypothetical protein